MIVALLFLVMAVDANPIAADPLSRFMAVRKSQHNENLFVFKEFYQSNVSKMMTPKRTYIEAGALDGRDLSNTWGFNKAFGWTGVLVEVSPKLYKSMLDLRRDSGDILLHGALCNPRDVDNNVTYHFVDNEKDRTAVGGIWELMDEGFKRAFYSSFKIDDAKLQTYPVVKCMSLGAELQKHNISHVDYFSLDIEGAELDFLSHFRHFIKNGSVTIDIISVEGYGDAITPKDAKVMALLNRVGYTFVGHGRKQPAYGWGSMWFLRNNSVVYEDYLKTPRR
jgi:hypothetical protein